MATNEDLRRGIGRANEAARRNIGKSNEASRRQIGQDMVERRTGQSQADDINAIVNVPRPRKTLRTVEPRGPLLGQAGTGTYVAPPAGSPGGGIASPLTEKTKTVQDGDGSDKVVPDRDYWPTTYFSTSDGLLLFEFRPTQVWRLTDADGGDVEINVARPLSATRPRP